MHFAFWGVYSLHVLAKGRKRLITFLGLPLDSEWEFPNMLPKVF